MLCQVLFSGKNKKNIISLSSAELAMRVVKVKNEGSKHCEFCYKTNFGKGDNQFHKKEAIGLKQKCYFSDFPTN